MADGVCLEPRDQRWGCLPFIEKGFLRGGDPGLWSSVGLSVIGCP